MSYEILFLQCREKQQFVSIEMVAMWKVFDGFILKLCFIAVKIHFIVLLHV